MTCHGRYNILSTLICAPQESKEMLREGAGLLQQHDKNLFGKKFREHLILSAKSKKQSTELICDKGKKKQKPFQYDPSETPRRSSRVPQKFFLKMNSSGTARQQQSFGGYQQGSGSNRQGKNKKSETLFNMSFPHVIPTSELENVHPLIRKLFSAREVSKLPLAERLKHFVETWKILTKD